VLKEMVDALAQRCVSIGYIEVGCDGWSELSNIRIYTVVGFTPNPLNIERKVGERAGPQRRTRWPPTRRALTHSAPAACAHLCPTLSQRFARCGTSASPLSWAADAVVRRPRV